MWEVIIKKAAPYVKKWLQKKIVPWLVALTFAIALAAARKWPAVAEYIVGARDQITNQIIIHEADITNAVGTLPTEL
jgi:hypothetical protein